MDRRTMLKTAGAALAAPTVAAGTRVRPQDLVQALEAGVAGGAAGFSAAIATRDGVIWTGVAGLADIAAGTPIDEADRFGVASITKTFVVVAVMQLVEEGKVRLDRTSAQILGAEVVRGVANADKATLVQLMHHTSGIPSWEDDPAWIHAGRGSKAKAGYAWGKEETLEYIRGHPALFAPGEGFSYSNTNHTLLGLIIEKVTGRSAAAELRRRILAPLGLTSTYLEGFEPRPEAGRTRRYHYVTPTFLETAGLSPAYSMVREGLADVTAVDLSTEWTAGGMVSTPRDLVVFARALRDGVLVKPDTLKAMTAWDATDNPERTVGFGLFRITNSHGAFIGHSGSALGCTAGLYWAEEGDAVLAVTSNTGAYHAGETGPTGSKIALNSDFTDRAVRFARGA